MSAPATPAGPPSRSTEVARAVGVLALALAISVVVQNVIVIAAGAPGYGNPIPQVLAFHAEQRGAVAVAVGLEAVNLPLLLGFLTGLHGLVVRRHPAAALWSRLAMLAGAVVSSAWGLYAVLWVGTALAADTLTSPSPAFRLAWHLHAAAFAFALPALGTTLVGASLATHASGLTPPWQRVVGLAGGGLLVLAGACSLAIADGSPLLFIGMPGYLAFLVWLLATGARLVRRPAHGTARFPS